MAGVDGVIGSGSHQMLAVMLGASRYSNALLDNDCFARSHADLRCALEQVVGLSDGITLFDYFDHEEFQTWPAIRADLAVSLEKVSQATYLLVVYIGHGERGGTDDKLRLGLRGSDESFSSGTVVTGEMLSSFFNEKARGMAHFYVVDACFGGLIAPDLQRPQSWNANGVAVLAASERDKALAPPDSLHTAFSSALIDVLRRGTEGPSAIALQGLHRTIRENVHVAFGSRAPEPFICRVEPPKGVEDGAVDLLERPLFPNAARTIIPVVIGSTWETRVDEPKRLHEAIDVLTQTRNRDAVQEMSGGMTLLRPEPAFLADRVVGDPFALKRAAVAVTHSRLVFADVTDYEPAVMLLLGMRAATTRGVTVCSAQARERLRLLQSEPFHMRDVALATHGNETRETARKLADRAGQGLAELLQLPQDYQDLPAFEALRNTRGPGERRLQRPWHEFVLMLCPFNQKYNEENWRPVSDNVKEAIRQLLERSGQDPEEPEVVRTIDLDSPRIVSQALFDALRRTQLCVFDLTSWRPGVLFEIGIRLAVSRTPPLCLIEERQLTALQQLDESTESRANWNDRWEKAGLDAAGALRIRDQVLGLVELLNPVKYDRRTDTWLPELVDAIAPVADPFAGSSGTNDNTRQTLVDSDLRWLIWRGARSTFDRHASSRPFLDEPVLRDAGRDQDAGQRYLVYPPLAPIWRHIREATSERQLMAWLYLDERRRHLNLDATMTARFVELGEFLRRTVQAGRAPSWVADAVEQRMRLDAAEADAEAAASVTDPSADIIARAKKARATARTQQDEGFYQEASTVLADAAELLEDELIDAYQWPDSVHEADGRERSIAQLLAQLWGEAGGNLRRAENWRGARDMYDRGKQFEQDARFGITDSYNLTNHKVASLMADPTSYQDLREQLEEDAALLQQQVSGVRQAEWWAWADAALLFVLARRDSHAKIAYREYIDRGDVDSFATSAHVLEQLANALTTEEREVANALNDHARELLAARTRL